jgi:hypothetical protein
MEHQTIETYANEDHLYIGFKLKAMPPCIRDLRVMHNLAMVSALSSPQVRGAGLPTGPRLMQAKLNHKSSL